MAKRIVLKTLKDESDDITHVLNKYESWSPRTVESVISDIESNVHSYVVIQGDDEIPIHVVQGKFKQYIRTNRDEKITNNLDELADVFKIPPYYLGNYPKNKKSDWSDNLQGVTHNKDHWFFTQKTKILKFHRSTDLDTDMESAVKVVNMDSELSSSGCNHFGDPDYIIYDNVGYLFIPVEQDDGIVGDCKNKPRIAVYRDDSELTYIGYSLLPKQNSSNGTNRAGWCAFNPIDNLLYTSYNKISSDFPIFRYKVDFEKLAQNQLVVLSEQEDFFLTKNGEPTSISQYIQGGCFSPEGDLFILNGKVEFLADESKGGIRAFDLRGEFLYESSLDHYPFKYEYHAGIVKRQEPEGICFWNLEPLHGGLSANKISGQLHAILLNNQLGNDKIYFKHYSFYSSGD